MTTLPDLVTEETLHIFISQMQKNYYNSLIKPKNLNKYVYIVVFVQYIKNCFAYKILEKFGWLLLNISDGLCMKNMVL